MFPKTVEFDYYVPDDLWFFDGHFPNNPVFPGIMLISLGIDKFRGKYPYFGHYRLHRISYCRFKDIVRPYEYIKLKFIISGQDDKEKGLEMNYIIEKSGKTCLKASLSFIKGALHD